VRDFEPQAQTSVIGEGLFPETPQQRPVWAPSWPYYLFIGSAEPRKRLEDAVALGSQLNDAGLIVIGTHFGRRRQITALLQDWHANHLTLHQQQCSDAELTWLYKHSRALLFPSLYEGFGLPPLESLRAGRPVIARNVGAMREHLHPHALWNHAWHQAGNDGGPENIPPHQLAQAIDQWAVSPALQQHLAQFRWETAHLQLSDAISQVLAS
jgi:glycosyltransferase involved in cell wall biosynthesis